MISARCRKETRPRAGGGGEFSRVYRKGKYKKTEAVCIRLGTKSRMIYLIPRQPSGHPPLSGGAADSVGHGKLCLQDVDSCCKRLQQVCRRVLAKDLPPLPCAPQKRKRKRERYKKKCKYRPPLTQ